MGVMEATMVKRYWVKAILFCALLGILFGCGGASKTTKQPAMAKGSDSPFGSAGSADDLRAPSDRSSAESDESYDSGDLRVPGAEYGKKASAKARKKKCPKGKKGKKCRASRKKSSGSIPFSEAIEGQMQGVPWGMHYKNVIAVFERKIKERYKEDLKNSRGAIEEDRIRSKMTREISKLKKSYIKFDGQRTGFEGDIVEEEFTHNNGESMIKWDAGKHVEYMFFFDGRLWKRVRSFRKDSFKDDITFDVYVSTLANRFGDGKEYRSDIDKLTEIKWQNTDTYMSARDKSGFFGVYCLAFTARVTEDNLSKLRTSRDRHDGSVDDGVSNVITTVTSGDLSDSHSSVIDGYTGSESQSTTSIDTSHSVMGKGKKKESSDSSQKKEEEDAPQGDDLDLF